MAGLAFSLAAAAPAGATWPGANGEIAFETTRDGNHEIYVSNPDGTDLVNLTKSSADDRNPQWSPDGSRIVFDSGNNFAAQIFVMNADGSGMTQLTHDPGFDVYPSFSPDGKRIVYTSTLTGSPQIWAMSADGSAQVELTFSAGNNIVPEYSPDGTKIAFASNRDGNFEIYAMNLDGSGQTNLTRNPAVDINPHWVPSGNGILFTSLRDGNLEIYGMRPDGSEPVDLTRSAGGDASGILSPDGFALAWTTDTPPHARVPRDDTITIPLAGGKIAIKAVATGKMRFSDWWFSLPSPFADPFGWMRPTFDLDEAYYIIPNPNVVTRAVPPALPRVAGAGEASYMSASWQPLRAGDLTLAVAGPRNAKRGKTVEYRLRAWNTRTGLADDGVKLTVALPRGVSVANLDPTCARAGKTLTCGLGALGGWEAHEITLKLRSRTARTFSLTASVSGSLPELDPASNTATKTTKIN
jgi:TolB protein